MMIFSLQWLSFVMSKCKYIYIYRERERERERERADIDTSSFPFANVHFTSSVYNSDDVIVAEVSEALVF